MNGAAGVPGPVHAGRGGCGGEYFRRAPGGCGRDNEGARRVRVALRQQRLQRCADKQAQALEDVKEEELVNIIFDRAYKILKNRYSSAERLNDTLRKIISSKISEMELTRKADI